MAENVRLRLPVAALTALALAAVVALVVLSRTAAIS
jgi:hypothetical protein